MTDSTDGQKSGPCPVCKHLVSDGGGCVAFWNGETKDGRYVSGGIHEAQCPSSSHHLVAWADASDPSEELLWEVKEM